MNIRKALIGLAITLILSAPGFSFADPSSGMMPPHARFHLMKFSGMAADKHNLYVMAGGKIMQYGLADLNLLKSIDLPMPVPPSYMQNKGQEDCSKFPPPPPPYMAGPQGLWAGEGFLYVLAGPMIYRYSTPDLTLKNTVELPKPEFPNPDAVKAGP